ncbi:MAG: hypothetical protein GX591_19315 [Planctomycetes bacterium]|nr:hypothetical protein [Planctomycetota bacterium]
MAMKPMALVVVVVTCLSASAWADAFSTGFEYADVAAMQADGWTVTGGAAQLVAAPVHGGGKSLMLPARAVMSRPLNEFGTMKLWVYDPGTIATATANGPRWGVSKGTEVIGATLYHRSWLGSAVAYAVNTGFLDAPVNNQWSSETWLDAGDITNPVPGPDDSRSRGVAGWMEWEIAYYPDGTIEINLLTDPNGGGAKAYSGRQVGVPGPVAPSSVSFADPATGGAQAVYLSGSWDTALPFGDLFVDDLVWTPYTGSVCNPGDADGDGDVDLDDFVILKNNFGTATGATCAQGDFDGDGDVDLDDFVLLKNNFGATY